MTVGVKLFCEDSAHESTATAFVHRVARELEIAVDISIGAARFGLPRLQRELRTFQALLLAAPGLPDVLVVMADANDVGTAARRHLIEVVLDRERLLHVVIGTPNPCVERWLLADLESFSSQFGVQPANTPASDRDVWKTRLASALEDAKRVVTQGGSEYADEIVGAMDLYRAGQIEPSLGAFISELRAALRMASNAAPGA